MTNLRQLSARPTLVEAKDPSSGTIVGNSGPLGRERCVFALPTRWVNLATPIFSNGVADPSGNLIGQETRITVHRMLAARWTEDTRRLSV